MKAGDQAGEESSPAGSSRFSELEELQREIALRLKDNQRFLARFLAEDYADDEDEKEDEPTDDEEL